MAKDAVTIRVQSEDFDPGVETQRLHEADPTVGAVATFLGLVRAHPQEDGAVTTMTLEHYPGMTEKALAAIVDEARRRWPLTAVTVIHRVGPLAVGDRIVFVGCASSHRAAAFAACEFLMDYLKTRAPFWKKETTASGETRWVEACASDEERALRW
ncbi:molybdopterin synthase catalytic subunit MoaE [Hydrogenophilus thermoluteolus]|uniref:molybdopterin synthase catalytic subunit MoaE n=1 Tax=Hydrogenophilus thermoluteolus TaxID=297 RepID=UPI003F668A54